MKIISTILAIVLIIAGCKKNEVKYGDFKKFDSTKSLLKVNYTSSYSINYPVIFKLNQQPISGIVTARYPYPGGGYNTAGLSTPDYLQVEPGTYEFSAATPQVGTTIDSVNRYKTNLTFESGKRYSLHIADTATNTKHVLIEDDFSRPDTSSARYRVINLIPNAPSIDLYNGTELVASNIKYLEISNYFVLTTTGGSSVWNVRETGTGPTGTVLATYNSTSTKLSQRSYTAFAMGYKGQTVATRRPYIAFFLVR